jgi:hypothetical protein
LLKFIASLLAVTTLLAIAFYLLSENHLIGWPGYFFEILAYVFFSTLIIYSLLYRIKQPSTFVQLYLLTMTVKLFGGAIFILLVVLKDRTGATANTAFFLLSYILFTGMEVAFLYMRNSGNRDAS